MDYIPVAIANPTASFGSTDAEYDPLRGKTFSEMMELQNYVEKFGLRFLRTSFLDNLESVAKAIKKGAVTPLENANNIGIDYPSVPLSMSGEVAQPQLQAKGVQEVEARYPEKVVQQRMVLLAAKYSESDVSKELAARLEILSQRLLSIAPRVSAEQVVALERDVDLLSEMEQSVANRAARFAKLMST